ncbi:MAG: HD-GYP domain-containing protein [Mycobacterium leprae]
MPRTLVEHLRPSYMRQLLTQGTGLVEIGEPLPGLPAAPEVVSAAVRRSVEAEMHAVMNQVAARFTLEAAASDRMPMDLGVGFHQLRWSTDRLVASMLTNSGVVFNLQHARTVDEYTLGHSVNVCVLSTLLGIALGYSPAELQELAIGALLHDIGKIAIPPSILQKPGRLTPAEFRVVQTHTTIGWSILAGQRSIGETAPVVALQHHESWDGGGYPQDLAGEQIHPFSQVVAVADCFDAMSSDRVYHQAMAPAVAMHAILYGMPGKFRTDVLEALVHTVAPYPVGSVVEITGGAQAVVTAVERGQTYRPRVRLLSDRSGARELELSGEPDLTIVRTLRLPGPDRGDRLADELTTSCSAE